MAVRHEFGDGLRARLNREFETQLGFDLDAAAPLVEQLPARTAFIFRVLPVGYADERPVVAIGDSTDELGMDCVRRALGPDVEFVEAAEQFIVSGLVRAYGDVDF